MLEPFPVAWAEQCRLTANPSKPLSANIIHVNSS
jgi:hypothetical protein